MIKNNHRSDLMNKNVWEELSFQKPLLIYRGFPFDKQVALTYDAGTQAGSTVKILDVLGKYGVKSTFFLTGDWVNKFPDLTQRMVKEKHELANHSFNHPDLTHLHYMEIVKQVIDGADSIKKISGMETRPLFRPPYGALSPDVLNAIGECGFHFCIQWSIDTLDWQNPPVRDIVKRILLKVYNGDIILMHLNGINTASATDIIIPKLKAREYRFVTVGELLNLGK